MRSTEIFPVAGGDYVVTLMVRTGRKGVSWSCTCGDRSPDGARLSSVEGRQQAQAHCLGCPGQAWVEAEANRPKARPGEGWIAFTG